MKRILLAFGFLVLCREMAAQIVCDLHGKTLLGIPGLNYESTRLQLFASTNEESLIAFNILTRMRYQPLNVIVTGYCSLQMTHGEYGIFLQRKVAIGSVGGGIGFRTTTRSDNENKIVTPSFGIIVAELRSPDRLYELNTHISWAREGLVRKSSAEFLRRIAPTFLLGISSTYQGITGVTLCYRTLKGQQIVLQTACGTTSWTGSKKIFAGSFSILYRL